MSFTKYEYFSALLLKLLIKSNESAGEKLHDDCYEARSIKRF